MVTVSSLEEVMPQMRPRALQASDNSGVKKSML